MLPTVGRPASDSSIFSALASETRRALLDVLFEGERSVGQLVERLEVSQPAISQQLAVLEASGLVEQRAEGRFRFYRLRPEPLAEVAEWIERYRAYWEARLDALGTVLDTMDETSVSKAKGRTRPRRKA
jgi:DNA-binding transcriptional ArsR family regulator